MNLDYADIFAVRGHRYHRAMTRVPGARRLEFARLFDRCPALPGESLLDLPAGGGYLRAHLPEGVHTTSRELTGGFQAGTEVLGAEDWALGQFDHVVCLAALHHIEDQPGFLSRLAGHVAPGGTLHVADVAAGTGLARFLDGFVGRYNETGHEGRYLDPDRLPLTGALRAGVVRAVELDCPWLFVDETQMLDFCTDLFGLADCPAAALLDALDRDVGVERRPDGVALRWRLLYMDVRPG